MKETRKRERDLRMRAVKEFEWDWWGQSLREEDTSYSKITKKGKEILKDTAYVRKRK